MALAPENGFYFEPIAERFALVVEGFPFPSDDAWSFVGDPVEMTREVARAEFAQRWPGVDPDALVLELTREVSIEDLERLQREDRDRPHGSREFEIDVDALLQEMQELERAAAELGAAAERASGAPAATVGEEIAAPNPATSTTKAR
jgi:hypothetical protein